jgi:hypothetical protein
VAEWKAALPQDFVHRRQEGAADDVVVRQQFTRALRIYAEFVSPRDAEFPINIAWHDLRKPQAVFEWGARSLVGTFSAVVDAAAPFADDSLVTGSRLAEWPFPTGGKDGNKASRSKSQSQVDILGPSSVMIKPHPVTMQNISASSLNNNRNNDNDSCSWDRVPNKNETPVHNGKGGDIVDIPETFDGTIFDAAQASIKYLVLTNTWPKYVRERHSFESSGSSRSCWTGSSSSSSSSSLSYYTGGSGMTTAAASTMGITTTTTGCGSPSGKEGWCTPESVKGFFGRLFR